MLERLHRTDIVSFLGDDVIAAAQVGHEDEHDGSHSGARN